MSEIGICQPTYFAIWLHQFRVQLDDLYQRHLEAREDLGATPMSRGDHALYIYVMRPFEIDYSQN